MSNLKRFLSRGEFPLSLVLGYFFAWFFALAQTTFSLYILGRIVFYFLCSAIVFFAFLMLITKIAKQPLFGATKLWFFPTKAAIIASVILSTLVGVTFALTGDTTLTTQRIVTLVVGYLGSIAAIMLYIYSLVDERNK